MSVETEAEVCSACKSAAAIREYVEIRAGTEYRAAVCADCFKVLLGCGRYSKLVVYAHR